jgi:hypothetical protein
MGPAGLAASQTWNTFDCRRHIINVDNVTSQARAWLNLAEH